MPRAGASAYDHDRDAEYYQRFLRKKRRKATEDPDTKWNSEEIRDCISKAFQAVFDGHAPYEWQLDVAEAVLLGIDTTLIARTGSGKTIPFILPLLCPGAEAYMVLIISPLKELQRDQVARFEKMGLHAVAVNEDSWSEALSKRICEGAYRVLLAGPEMCLKHPRFSALFRESAFTERIHHIVVDEAHCISTWGNGFRDCYAELERLRSHLSSNTAILACTATAPLDVVAKIRLTLGISPSNSYHLNLGNRRPNITKLILPLRTGLNDFSYFKFLIDNVQDNHVFPQAIIFFNEREMSHRASDWMKRRLSAALRSQIDFIHSHRTEHGKARVMRRWKEGYINMLCATDCAGLGMDNRTCVLVIEHGTPSNLLTGDQHRGCCGRVDQSSCHVLAVEPTALQVIDPNKKRRNKKKRKAQSDDECEGDEPTESSSSGSSSSSSSSESSRSGPDLPQLPVDTQPEPEEPSVPDKPPPASKEIKHRKVVDPHLRRFYETKECRAIVLDKFFENPPSHASSTVPCCDNCIRKIPGLEHAGFDDIWTLLETHVPLGTPAASLPLTIPSHEACPISPPPIPLPRPRATYDKRPKKYWPEYKKVIKRWRKTCWKTHYADGGLDPTILISDKQINILAHDPVRTMDDLRAHHTLKNWVYLDRHGQDALDCILELVQKHEAEEQAKRDEAETKRKSKEEADDAKRIRKEEDQSYKTSLYQHFYNKELQKQATQAQDEEDDMYHGQLQHDQDTQIWTIEEDVPQMQPEVLSPPKRPRPKPRPRRPRPSVHPSPSPSHPAPCLPSTSSAPDALIPLSPLPELRLRGHESNLPGLRFSTEPIQLPQAPFEYPAPTPPQPFHTLPAPQTISFAPAWNDWASPEPPPIAAPLPHMPSMHGHYHQPPQSTLPANPAQFADSNTAEVPHYYQIPPVSGPFPIGGEPLPTHHTYPTRDPHSLMLKREQIQLSDRELLASLTPDLRLAQAGRAPTLPPTYNPPQPVHEAHSHVLPGLSSHQDQFAPRASSHAASSSSYDWVSSGARPVFADLASFSHSHHGQNYGHAVQQHTPHQAHPMQFMQDIHQAQHHFTGPQHHVPQGYPAPFAPMAYERPMHDGAYREIVPAVEFLERPMPVPFNRDHYHPSAFPLPNDPHQDFYAAHHEPSPDSRAMRTPQHDGWQ